MSPFIILVCIQQLHGQRINFDLSQLLNLCSAKYFSSESSKLSSHPHLGQLILFSMTFLVTLTIVFLLYVFFKINESAHSRHSPIPPFCAIHAETKAGNPCTGQNNNQPPTSNATHPSLRILFRICHKFLRPCFPLYTPKSARSCPVGESFPKNGEITHLGMERVLKGFLLVFKIPDIIFHVKIQGYRFKQICVAKMFPIFARYKPS